MIATLLSVLESLEEEDSGALSHDESVRTFTVRAGARCRQCSYLAELHECACTHVGVDSAGEDRVVVTLLQAFDGSIHPCKGGCTCGIGHEVGTVEVEEVCDPSSGDVGELARHGVLGDLGEDISEPSLQLVENRRPDGGVQSGEAGGPGELARVLGGIDA